jgi:hypothetical protein
MCSDPMARIFSPPWVSSFILYLDPMVQISSPTYINGCCNFFIHFCCDFPSDEGFFSINFIYLAFVSFLQGYLLVLRSHFGKTLPLLIFELEISSPAHTLCFWHYLIFMSFSSHCAPCTRNLHVLMLSLLNFEFFD